MTFLSYKIISFGVKLIKVPIPIARLYQLGEVAMAVNMWDEAARNFEEVLLVFPDHIKTLRFLGIACTNLKRYERAIEIYSQLAKLQPDQAYPHAMLGVIYYQIDKYDNAIEAYNEAINRETNRRERAKLLFMLGQAYTKNRNYPEATNAFHNAIEISRLAETYKWLGEVYFMQGQNDKAEEAFREALVIDPGYVNARNWLASLHEQ